jgi:hypothetical protein
MATAQVINKQSTDTQARSGLSVSVYVYLSDLEQIVIDVPITDWRNGLRKVVGTEKFRIEELNYSTHEGQFYLSGISGRGFRQDGKLKVRDTHLYFYDQATLDQIPSEYHNYAIEAFAKEVVEIENELTAIKHNGLQVKAKN